MCIIIYMNLFNRFINNFNKNMSIEKIGKNRYSATGNGLVAFGRTHYKALCNLLEEIEDMRSLYSEYFNAEQTKELLTPKYY